MRLNLERLQLQTVRLAAVSGQTISRISFILSTIWLSGRTGSMIELITAAVAQQRHARSDACGRNCDQTKWFSVCKKNEWCGDKWTCRGKLFWTCAGCYWKAMIAESGQIHYPPSAKCRRRSRSMYVVVLLSPRYELHTIGGSTRGYGNSYGRRLLSG